MGWWWPPEMEPGGWVVGMMALTGASTILIYGVVVYQM